MKKAETIGFGCRLIVGVALIWSATPKIVDAGLFYQNVAAYGVLDDAWSAMAAMTVPWLELALGLALLARIAAPGATLLTAVLFAGFTTLQGWGLATGIDAPCGCFDVGTDGQINAFTVGRVAMLTAIALIAAYLELAPPPTVRRHARPSDGSDAGPGTSSIAADRA